MPMAAVERATAMALLPGLLPTPPRSTMITPSPCIIILPVASNPKFPKPGRADAAERWDAHKKDDDDDDKTTNPRRSPASSSCGSSTSPGRADSCQRWDINKIKKTNTVSSTSSSSMSSRGSTAISGERYKRPPSRASSAGRWDAHKKPRDALSDAESQTGEEATSKEEDETTKMEETLPVFSGPTFVASPEPSMLPMPAFFARRAGINPLPAFVQAH